MMINNDFQHVTEENQNNLSGHSVSWETHEPSKYWIWSNNANHKTRILSVISRIPPYCYTDAQLFLSY
jgi:hypothetical protein